MELIIIELFSFAVAVAVLIGSRTKSQSKLPLFQQDIPFVSSVYLGYLSLAIINHFHMLGFIQYPALLARIVFVIHIVSLPVYICSWMCRVEKAILPKSYSTIIVNIQYGVLLLFSIIEIGDLFIGKLFVFNANSVILSGGYGMRAMMILSTLYVLINLIIVLIRWQQIGLDFRLISLISPIFLLISLGVFQAFRQPYLLSLTSTFMLLMITLAWQRRELMLDLLTKIPNNQAFLETLNRMVHNGQDATILMVDIENFRLINQRYTEEFGDKVLQKFATFLVTNFPQAKVYRVVGNRFALLFPKLTHNAIVRIIVSIRARTTGVCDVEDVPISFHTNIAIVEIPLAKNTVDEIVESLSFTLGEIKEKRRQSVIIFNQKLVDVRQRRLDIISVLKRAVVDHQMVQLYLQPVVDIEHNCPISAEALMRIQDENLGAISPGEFIPLAEQVGLISSFTEIMLEKVCDFIAQNQELVNKLSHISINISAEDISNHDAAIKLLNILNRSGVNPRKIGFELTESMLLEASTSVTKSWKIFQNLGILFLLDDFGSGYANLETLANLPFQIVKIDRSVVSNAKNSYEILSLITGMLHQLGKQMIAEGVETEEQLSIVKSVNIQNVQGFYYSKPLGFEEFVVWLQEHQCL